ncbi:hypothetical protein ES705_15963 [subsurface metagenome]
MLVVKVNCPIPGCGVLVRVQNLPKHIEKVHELGGYFYGEAVLKLHPTDPYHYTPADIQDLGEEVPESLKGIDEAMEKIKEEEAEPETEPDQEP